MLGKDELERYSLCLVVVIQTVVRSIACADPGITTIFLCCRLMFFEQAREQSEKEHEENPEDAHVRKHTESCSASFRE